MQVDYYGAMTPLKTICGVSAPDSRTLLIQPYDMGAMQAIEKGIMKSDLGLTPNNDGKVIRINIPQLTAVRYRLRGRSAVGRGQRVQAFHRQ